MSKKVINKQTISVMALFSRNINESLHGREIARRLKANQKTINNNLNLLGRENILKGQKKGRNKEYTINKDNYIALHMLTIAEHYKYMRLAENFELYIITSEIAKAVSGIALIYGSYAKGTAEKDSDLDILIIGECKKEKLKAIKNKSPIEIHTIIMSKESFLKALLKKESFVKEIIENHIIIKGCEEFTEVRFEHEPD